MRDQMKSDEGEIQIEKGEKYTRQNWCSNPRFCYEDILFRSFRDPSQDLNRWTTLFIRIICFLHCLLLDNFELLIIQLIQRSNYKSAIPTLSSAFIFTTWLVSLASKIRFLLPWNVTNYLSDFVKFFIFFFLVLFQAFLELIFLQDKFYFVV